jgi:hypothetical protein
MSTYLQQHRSAIARACAVAAAILAALALSACGSDASKDAAITVGKSSVSKADVAHWVKVEAVISHEVIPKGPPAKGLIPDPPDFVACMGYERAQRPAAARKAPPRTPAMLRQACQQRYEAIRNHVLAILTTFQWLQAEGDKLGVGPSDAEITKRLANLKTEQFSSPAGFNAYLKNSGETLADERLVLKINLLVTKLEHYIVARDGKKASAFFTNFPRRWAAKTSCAPGYVIPNCRQYKGSEPPEAAA